MNANDKAIANGVKAMHRAMKAGASFWEAYELAVDVLLAELDESIPLIDACDEMVERADDPDSYSGK